MRVLRIGYRVGRKTAFQCADKKEPQSGDLIHHRSHREFSFVQKMGLPLTDMFWAKLIGRLAEVAGEPLDSAQVTAYSG